jgi:hypothetical protein
MVFLLMLAESGVDVKESCKESPKLGALYQGIYRKALITDDGKVTLVGRELMSFASESSPEATKVKKRIVVSGFDEWWKAYPGTDTFSHKEKTFNGTRSLRTKKDDCKAKFNKILEEGEYTAQELIDALKFEVEQKKENSVKEKTNKLKFMQNSLTYLNQRTFEPFIELIKSGVTIVEAKEMTGSTDI